MELIDILKRAKDLIAERGWTQGRYEDPSTGCVCALGAIIAAQRGSVGTDPTELQREIADWKFSAVADALEGALPTGSPVVWMYNDEPGRTVEHIYAMFDRAIAGLEVSA